MSGGRYLSPKSNAVSNARRKIKDTFSTTSSLQWNGAYPDVKNGGAEYEFIVHLLDEEEQLLYQSSESTRKSIFKFRSSLGGSRNSSRSGYQSDSEVSSRSGSLWDPVSEISGDRRSRNKSKSGDRKSRKKSKPHITRNYLNAINKSNNTESVRSDSRSSRRANSSGSRKHRSVGNKAKFSRATFAFKPEGANLTIGSVIMLESKQKPGYFIQAMRRSNIVQLSKTEPGRFEITSPELRHLVKLPGTRESRMISPMETEREVTELRESEKEWLRLLQELPLDIVYRILQFQGHWVRTARLVCRAWRSAAELHIRRIRVNGDFEFMGNESQRRILFDFINRCKYLQKIEIRNVDDIRDDDLKSLRLNTHLVKVSFGGCTNLTDMSIKHLTQLKSLTQINLACTKVTDAGLYMIAQSLPNLVHVNLYNCKSVTLRGVLNIIVRLKKLEDLNIRGTGIDFMHPRHLEDHNVAVLMGPENVEGIYS